MAQDQDDQSGSGAGGESGKVKFKAFISLGENQRDDLLSSDEKRRLLAVHEGAHQADVKKQKETRDQRQAIKEGKVSLQTYRQGLGGGMQSQYKNHPMLSDKAQFSGIDRQVNTLPNENVAETNQEKRDELQLQYSLVYRPENAPRFNPKPIMNR